MKRLVFLFIVSLMAHYSALAETILPFVQDGKVWVYDVSNFINNWEETFSLEGDTLIGTRNCLKLYYTCQVYGQEHVYRGAMFYKSNGNVCFIAPGSTTPVLMYDFASEPGTIINVGPFELKIKAKRIAKYHGEYLKAIDYSPIEREGFEGQWIDGVGIISGGNLTQLVEGNATWATGGERQLKTCAVNGEVVFEWNDFHSSSQIVTEIEEYYPEGTKWTEIRLDTLKYNSWYSKVGDDWVPNFETIEYYVKGEFADNYFEYKYKKVYSNGPEWTDSLTLLISYGESYGNSNCIFVKIPENQGDIICPSEIYQFDWSVGKRLWFQNMLEANTTCFPPCGLFNYGIIDEIKEGDFGGVRPLKYVDLSGKAPIDPERPWLDYADTNGGRIIQGIGITEWNDGECLFGPPNPYYAMTGSYNDRHYRSMLVHFERDGEVLYDVWPEKEAATEVTYTEGQMATIVLPTEPDAGKGKYYRLDRVEAGEIIFEQELQPRAHVPYIVVPSEDFSIELGAQEVEGLTGDTVSVEGVSFIGTYHREEINPKEGFSVRIIDTTPDCSHLPGEEQGVSLYVGALRAYLLVHWDDPYNPGGTKAPADKMEIVLKDNPNSIRPLSNTPLKGEDIYDLSGRKLSTLNFQLSTKKKAIYIQNNRKLVK